MAEPLLHVVFVAIHHVDGLILQDCIYTADPKGIRLRWGLANWLCRMPAQACEPAQGTPEPSKTAVSGLVQAERPLLLLPHGALLRNQGCCAMW